jgi:hypothetical protein
MGSSRLPRFIRFPAIAPVELTQRDRQVVALFQLHRFLQSRQITALISNNRHCLLRRLQLLYHHGYLERPRAQLDYYHKGGSRPIVYGLGSKGASLLRKELGDKFHDVRWGEKNRSVRRIFLEHALLVSDVMVTLELACRRAGNVRLLCEDQLIRAHINGTSAPLFRWRVGIGGGVTLGVVPDRVFALEVDKEGKTERAYFCLEADRGTMPVGRKNLSQTSMYRKFLAYAATWSNAVHEKRFGFHRFRVLTVTRSAERAKSLVEACSKLERGHGLFLFADESVLKNPDLLSAPLCHTGRLGERSSLL